MRIGLTAFKIGGVRMEQNIPQWLINTTDKNILQTNLSFISLFIAVYENMVDSVITKIKDFLCEEYIVKGEIFYNETLAPEEVDRLLYPFLMLHKHCF